MASGPTHQWARVGAARAERAGGRSGARSGAGKRARRSGAQPGLDSGCEGQGNHGLNTASAPAGPGAATGRVEVGARAPQQNPSANGLAERRHHRGLLRAPDRTPAGIDLAQPLGGADPSGGKGSAQVRPELDRARLALTRNTQNARLRIRRPRVLTCPRNVLNRQNAASQLPSSSQRRLECPASSRTPGRAGARRLRCEAAGTGTAPGVTRRRCWHSPTASDTHTGGPTRQVLARTCRASRSTAARSAGWTTRPGPSARAGRASGSPSG